VSPVATQEPAAKVSDARGIWEPQHDEHDYLVEEVEGALPDGLHGTLYRIGPGKFESGGQPLGHLWDGDGLLSMFVLDGGVRFRSRYVRTNHYRAGLEGKGVPGRLPGTNRQGGLLGNILRMPANVANTNVVLHHGELYALCEFGKPYRVDPDTLETLGEHDFDGRLRWMGAFSAHFKIDPASGELWNFGMEMIPRPTIRCYRVDGSGRLNKVGAVHLPDMVANHDFALTEHHMVFVLDPVVIDLPHALQFALLGTVLTKTTRWKPERGTTIVLVPRDGGKPRVVQTDALFHLHVNNAYEDGSDTVVDLVRYSQGWDALLPHFDRFRTTDGDGIDSFLTRLRITPAGRVEREDLCDLTSEFPQHDWRCTTREHRYSYLATALEGHWISSLNAITKIDHRTGKIRQHVLPSDNTVGEPIFVPRQKNAAEDDGWLLVVAYDPTKHRSRLIVLDAREPEREALFVAHLRHHIPLGFHGSFSSRIASSIEARM
jgi:all-trans-8'-apo-beta-carotenal 15,15'-oxygenase